MIPPFCKNPPCAIFSTCKKKFQTLPTFGPKDQCRHRPAPFVVIRRDATSIGEDLARMAKQEHYLRLSANESGD
jgi:hypothetical protein